MAFLIHSVSDGHIPSFVYLPIGAVSPKAGMAMRLENGKLITATGSQNPTHICMLEGESGHGSYDGELIPAICIEDSITFGTTNSADFTGVNIGDKVTIAADGNSVTATKTSGIAKVVGIAGAAVGSDIQVRFNAIL